MIQYRCEKCKVYFRPFDEMAYSLDGVSWTDEIPKPACNFHRPGSTFDYQTVKETTE